MIGASQGCRIGKWVTYDRHFHLKASAIHTKQWSTIDVTIWNMTFSEKAIYNHQSRGRAPYNSPYLYASQQSPSPKISLPQTDN